MKEFYVAYNRSLFARDITENPHYEFEEVLARAKEFAGKGRPQIIFKAVAVVERETPPPPPVTVEFTTSA